MGRHISDTYRRHWEIYYVHPQSGHMLSVGTLCWMAADCLVDAFSAANTCRQT